MSRYSIEESSLSAIADSIRELRQENVEMTPGEMAEKIGILRIGTFEDCNMSSEDWVRPEDWPDLDSIEMPDDFDGVYLTYDLRKTPGYGWIGISVNLPKSGLLRLDRGHLENGIFVEDATYTSSSTTQPILRIDLDEEDGFVQLWRVTATQPITRFWFRTKRGDTNYSIAQKIQPCVEATGQLLFVTSIGSDALDYRPSFASYSTIWLEHDSRAVKSTALTTIANAWYQSFSLRSIDFSKWDTSQARVTGINSAWADCFSLRYLDLNSLDTSNWVVSNMTSMCNACYSLKSFDAKTWDTSKWAVTNISSAWYTCFSLLSLDLNNWDTSNWAVTTIRSLLDSCRSLEEIDFGNWDTGNWNLATNALVYTFYNLTALRSMKGCENWTCLSKVTTSGNIPNGRQLQEFTGIPVVYSHSYDQCIKLTRESLVKILSALPTVSGMKITLGTANTHKLTPEEIAIATSKGWTVA